MGRWNLKQRFTFRISTFLYLLLVMYVAVHIGLDLDTHPDPGLVMFGRFALGLFPFLCVFTSILGLSFFISSCIGRNPQLQFFVEGLFGFFIGLPTVFFP